MRADVAREVGLAIGRVLAVLTERALSRVLVGTPSVSTTDLAVCADAHCAPALAIGSELPVPVSPIGPCRVALRS